MGKQNIKKQQAVQREKRLMLFSIIIFAVGVIGLTSVFLHFDIFTYKSVFFEYNEQEIAVSEKIKKNTYDADVDAYGNVLIPKMQISSETVSYFEAEEYDARILAYKDGNFNCYLALDSCRKCEENNKTGWFFEEGGYLYCSVCGNGIALTELGSLNPSSEIYPKPITKKMYEERRSVLAIPKDVME